jgi:hypothetical protein
MRRFPPERIVCLTEETVEILYLLRGRPDRGRFWLCREATGMEVG